MSAIKNQSLRLAEEEAYRLWAYCGSQYFEKDEMLSEVSLQVLKSLSVFAISCRRILESFEKTKKFKIDQSPWKKDLLAEEIESDLWRSTNLVIHAKKLQIRFSTLNQGTYINGAQVISHADVSTDTQADQRISPFGMAYAFLSEVMPTYKNSIKG